MRESSLYTKWMSDVINYNQKKFGNYIRKTLQVLYDFNELKIQDLTDIIYLVIIVQIVAIFIFLFEIHFKSIKFVFITMYFQLL